MTKLMLAISSCLLAALMVASGCGGSSGPTKAEFIEEADVICRKGNEKKSKDSEAYLLKLRVGGGKLLTPNQVAFQMTDVVLPPVETLTRQLAALEPPDGEEDKIDAIVQAAERGIAGTKAEAEGWRRTGEVPNEEIKDPFEEVAELSRDYGFKDCFINY